MKIVISLIIVIVLLVLLEIIRETHSFRMTYYDIASDTDMKVVFLSDLHNQKYGKKNQKLFEAIKEQQPDIILIGGDMLVGKNGHDYRTAEKFVKALVAICPVYYANGNHEQRMKERPQNYDISYQTYHDSLAAEGVHFLENTSACIEEAQKKVVFTGLEIPLCCYRHFGKEKMEEGTIEQRVGKPVSDGFQILLAHNPSYMEEYMNWGADLILSGHLHGGIVRIPGICGVISPDFSLFPKYSGGYYREGDTQIVVSRGLGMHTIPVRLFNPAEVIVLRLCPRKQGSEDGVE